MMPRGHSVFPNNSISSTSFENVSYRCTKLVAAIKTFYKFTQFYTYLTVPHLHTREITRIKFTFTYALTQQS